MSDDFYNKAKHPAMDDHWQNILSFWFGRIEETVVPTANRARVWFGESAEINAEMTAQFQVDLAKAIAGDYDNWQAHPHGRLALIVLLDQFSRHINANQLSAYTQDPQALNICLEGIEQGADHRLSLIERVFYYFPLLHAEDLRHQEQSIILYQNLAALALPETHTIYESFLRFAAHHHDVIERFGRFPQRNRALGRTNTKAESDYLNETEHDS